MGKVLSDIFEPCPWKIGSYGGDVAQLVERCFRKAEAGGSIPLISTTPEE